MENFHNIGTSTDWIIMIVYFVAVLGFGSYFSKYNRSTKDFFFGGRRFTWWLIAFSIVATGVGSHSFVKYSAMGFKYGFSSSMTYMNDWFFVPLFLFGWLPIIVYSKIRSIPEYFEKRFSPAARFIATVLLLFYMVGYVGIGFLTLGKAMIPLLPESFTLMGVEIQVTIMGVITVIAIITGIYITFGGQTAVIFTDLLQGVILIFAGLLVFVLGLDYLGGFNVFWDLLPTTWKLPLAHYNTPSDFNFVGIFWQDGVAGSIGFLFMNMGLVMRFMATKSVNEGRKAAVFNILTMLPVSAIVVSCAGWIGKAISVQHPEVVSPNTNPDQVFVVVANVISHPGVFGFIMAALTAALMSTVDTLINATAAIYINDIYRPIRNYFGHHKDDEFSLQQDKKELSYARWASIVFTVTGVLIVPIFLKFPTVYEAHGYFHSTLTPPLVVGIFMGVFWKKFTPAAVIATFAGGVALMIIGSNFPAQLIGPFDHGIAMNESTPYSYIRALYNTLVCVLIGIVTTYSNSVLKTFVKQIKSYSNHAAIVSSLFVITVLLYILIILNIGNLVLLIIAGLFVSISSAILATYYIKYNEATHTEGLTIWSLKKAKEMFKGSKLNEKDGEVIRAHWVEKEYTEDIIHASKNDMERMSAEVGDLVYFSDARKYLGGLKSVHSTFGEPHEEEGIIYINKEHLLTGVFIPGKILTVEKEM